MTSQKIIEGCSKEERNFINDSINDYNHSHVPAFLPDTWIPLEYIVKDESKNIIGGLLSGLGYWGGLQINILWVREDQRKNGIGTQLLKHVEQDAVSKGATISILDTFDFQAKEFYLKNGYAIFGELNDFPKGHRRYYLSKKLTGK